VSLEQTLHKLTKDNTSNSNVVSIFGPTTATSVQVTATHSDKGKDHVASMNNEWRWEWEDLRLDSPITWDKLGAESRHSDKSSHNGIYLKLMLNLKRI